MAMDERDKRRWGLYVFWTGFVMLMTGYYVLYLLGVMPAQKAVFEILAPALIVGSFPVFYLAISLGTFDDARQG